MLKLVLTLFLFLFVSCASFANNSIGLCCGLKSYMPIKKVQNIIKQRNGSYDIIEDTYLSDGRPKYRFSKIKTTIFKYKGLNGTTFLEFFNNQLMSVTFYPENKKNISTDDYFESNSIMKINHDIENRLYFKWSDEKLERQLENWLKKYS